MRDLIERLSYQSVGAISLACSLSVFFGAYFASEMLHHTKRVLTNRWLLSALTLLALPLLAAWQFVLVLVSAPRALYSLFRYGETHWSHR